MKQRKTCRKKAPRQGRRRAASAEAKVAINFGSMPTRKDILNKFPPPSRHKTATPPASQSAYTPRRSGIGAACRSIVTERRNVTNTTTPKQCPRARGSSERADCTRRQPNSNPDHATLLRNLRRGTTGITRPEAGSHSESPGNIEREENNRRYIRIWCCARGDIRN